MHKKSNTIILTALDFSPCAINALEYAIKSHADYNAKIVLVHAIQNKYFETFINKLIDKKKSKTKINIDKKFESILKNKMEYLNLNFEYEIITEFGSPLEIILKTIRKVKPFILIVGAKKTTTFIQKFFKNDTIKLIEQAKCPVIIVPEGVKYKKIERITFATDYKASDIMSIKNLTEQAKPFNIKIQIIHIAEGEYSKEFEEIMLKDFLYRVNKKTTYKEISYKLIEAENIDTIIKNQLTHKQTDLFSLSTSLHYGWLSKIVESKISKILKQSKVPIMAYHYKKTKDELYSQQLSD